MLLPKALDKRSHRNKGWKLHVNAKTEIGNLRHRDAGMMKVTQTNISTEWIQPEIRILWARTTLRVTAGKYRLISLPTKMLAEAACLVAKRDGRFAALIVEPDEVSLTIHDSAWQTSSLRQHATSQSGPFRAITFNLDLNPAIIGYFAPAAHRLAEAGISIVPQCAFLKDHLLIQEADLIKAKEVLKKLIADCKNLLRLQPCAGSGPVQLGNRFRKT